MSFSGLTKTEFLLNQIKMDQRSVISTKEAPTINPVINTRSVLVAKKPDNTYVNLNSDYNGDLKVKLGRSNLTAFGDISVSNLTPIVQELFTYNLNTRSWTIVGNCSVDSSMAVVETGIIPGTTSRLDSKKHIIYRPGQGILSRFTGLFSLPVASSSGFIGIRNDSDGYQFGYNGVDFGILYLSFGNPIFIPQSTWNRDKADGTQILPMMNWQNGNVFQIQMQYLGFGNVAFFVENPNDGSFLLVHEISYAGINIVPTLSDPSLKFNITVNNGPSTNNIYVKSASVGLFIEGPSKRLGHSWGSDHNKTGINSTQTPIISIRNKLTYAGKTNNSILYPRLFNLATINGSKPCLIKIYKNVVLSAPVWSDIDTNNSYAERSTVSATFTGGYLVTSFYLSKEDAKSVDLSNLNEFLEPGDIITITGSTSSGTIDCYASLNWVEG